MRTYDAATDIATRTNDDARHVFVLLIADGGQVFAVRTLTNREAVDARIVLDHGYPDLAAMRAIDSWPIDIKYPYVYVVKIDLSRFVVVNGDETTTMPNHYVVKRIQLLHNNNNNNNNNNDDDDDVFLRWTRSFAGLDVDEDDSAEEERNARQVVTSDNEYEVAENFVDYASYENDVRKSCVTWCSLLRRVDRVLFDERRINPDHETESRLLTLSLNRFLMTRYANVRDGIAMRQRYTSRSNGVVVLPHEWLETDRQTRLLANYPRLYPDSSFTRLDHHCSGEFWSLVVASPYEPTSNNIPPLEALRMLSGSDFSCGNERHEFRVAGHEDRGESVDASIIRFTSSTMKRKRRDVRRVAVEQQRTSATTTTTTKQHHRFEGEQLALVDIVTNYMDPTHSVLVNGDPGTGKSTVALHCCRKFQRPLYIVPTNRQRERAETYADRVNTVSSCVKRLGAYRSHPQRYADLLRDNFSTQMKRLRRLVSFPEAFDDRLNNVFHLHRVRQRRKKRNDNETSGGVTNKHPLPPDCVLFDEVNMTDWRQVTFVNEGVKRLGCSVLMLGDSQQTTPIGAETNNAELIALSSSLVVQLSTIRRVNSEDPLQSVLSDPIWSSTTSLAVGSFVRQLLRKHFRSMLQLDISAVFEDWLVAIRRHDEHARCSVYLRNEAIDIARLDVTAPRNVRQPFLIALRNRTCDEFNYRFGRLFYRYARQRAPEIASRHMAATKRSAFVPRRTLDAVPCNEWHGDAVDNNSDTISGTILDDEFAPFLFLCVGMRYVFLGNDSDLAKGTVIRLVAITPDTDTYRDDCHRCKMTTPSAERKLQRVLVVANDDRSTLHVVRPTYYNDSRYASVWSSRAGSCLYGWPLRLACSSTSFKAQGETLNDQQYPDVYVDVAGMSREQVLVSLSRVVSGEQIRSVANIDKCCRR